MKIGFSTLACPEWSWTDIYSMAKDFKFDGVIKDNLVMEIKTLNVLLTNQLISMD